MKMIQIPQYESNISVEELVGEQDEINGRERSRQKRLHLIILMKRKH